MSHPRDRCLPDCHIRDLTLDVGYIAGCSEEGYPNLETFELRCNKCGELVAHNTENVLYYFLTCLKELKG